MVTRANAPTTMLISMVRMSLMKAESPGDAALVASAALAAALAAAASAASSSRQTPA
jgi:hypothetical protein